MCVCVSELSKSLKRSTIPKKNSICALPHHVESGVSDEVNARQHHETGAVVHEIPEVVERVSE